MILEVDAPEQVVLHSCVELWVGSSSCNRAAN